jgi:hypothetical protein
MQVDIDDVIIQKVKQMFPDSLSNHMTSNDLSFCVEWFASLGIDAVNSLLQKNSAITLGEVITKYKSSAH